MRAAERQDVGSVSMQAAGHMFVSIQKIRSRRANGHTRKYCRNSPSNALAVTREAEEDWARQQWRRANSSIVPSLNVKTTLYDVVSFPLRTSYGRGVC